MNYFGSIFSATTTLSEFLIAVIVSMVLGLLVSVYYMYKNNHSRSMTVALVVLPAMVTMIIMLVNGNVGTGLAVAGSFSLIRFRSAAGNAKDLMCVFLDVAIGLACGTGYVVLATIFSLIVLVATFILSTINYGDRKANDCLLKITVPEDLNYYDAFTDIFDKYTSRYELQSAKTIALGSLFRCEYELTLKDITKQKEFVDELRVRNGNLEISLGKKLDAKEAL